MTDPLDPPIVDAHAHIFRHDMPLSATAWTRPSYGFSAEDYLAVLDAHGVHFGVISGISISGYYNDYMIEQLRQHRRLRGTVIIPPTTERYVLDRMRDDGIVGVRLQLTRRDQLPDLAGEDYQLLLRRIADLDWHVHVALEGRLTPPALEVLQASGVKIVIDHFGHPEPGEGVNCAGFQSILCAVGEGRTWVKLSAAYRLMRTEGDEAAAEREAMAETLSAELLRQAGPERLVWGSDCPFVGYEEVVSYRATLDAFARWVPDPAARRKMSDTALKLYFS